ncbi:MAG: hypothetical protein JSU00_10900 [Acidobacteria bacterium]|nr:hypothetical protein [Acidobacteriota bacterium]
MPTEATAHTHPAPEIDPHLRFYLQRDEFMRNYLPATQEEKLLITHACRAWMHLQDIEALIDVVTQGRGLFTLYTEHYDRYKQLNRDLSQAERMWNRAISAFWQARKRNSRAVGKPHNDDWGVLVPSRRPSPTPEAESAPPPEPVAKPAEPAPAPAPPKPEPPPFTSSNTRSPQHPSKNSGVHPTPKGNRRV